MASNVDIVNLALSYLGDSATVSSIDPPEGSAQAEHASRFYPIARNSLLEMHNWSFSSKRVTLAQVTQPFTEWTYAYAVPSDCMQALAIHTSTAGNDYSEGAGLYTPQPFSQEIDSLGNPVIYANIDDAVLRYQALVTDSGQFSSLFTLALTWHLASMLAGPLLKGDVGANESKRCIQMMSGYLATAKQGDSSRRMSKPDHIVPWTAGR